MNSCCHAPSARISVITVSILLRIWAIFFSMTVLPTKAVETLCVSSWRCCRLGNDLRRASLIGIRRVDDPELNGGGRHVLGQQILAHRDGAVVGDATRFRERAAGRRGVAANHHMHGSASDMRAD